MLNDSKARKAALTSLEKSQLVEAGAGSGKTSLLAGRIVTTLASGVQPREIAAVSFTEMAASELRARVSEFVDKVIAGNPPPDLKAAFPKGGLSDAQRKNLEKARDQLGEMTCTTIHGFCQRLLKPYPVEAFIDPGARILDSAEAELMFADVFDVWIRARLSGHDRSEDIITEMVSIHDEAAVGINLIRELALLLKSSPDLTVDEAAFDAKLCERFEAAADEFRDWCAGLGFEAEGNEKVRQALSACADQLRGIGFIRAHTAVVKIATLAKDLSLFKADGGFRQYRMKGKWTSAAPSKRDGEEANTTATSHYEKCTELLSALRANAAAAGLAILADEIRPLLDEYQERKLDAAALDFEDLLFSTRKMLRNYPKIAAELGKRFSRILVDEFQDTDPVQAEIFKLLSFDLKGEIWIPRPGAIFLVGDPKQAIYRFRGADVKTYLEMRDLLMAHDPTSVLQVSTNFRSSKAILEHVNEVFEFPLSLPSQPGFTKLDHFRKEVPGGPAVVKFRVSEKPTIAEARDDEAKSVAEICRRMIGSYPIYDKETGSTRACMPSDIALLAPTGSDLWRYEHALEEEGISVATQAGKGMFQRQEIHDLIAITRVLADPRDQLALGALLRGPLVGLTEAELLDASHALPPCENGSLPFIRVGLPSDHFKNSVLKHVLAVLGSLRKRADATTPHDILSQAVEELNVRATLRARHRKSPDRALANVDRFLEMSRPYSVRGLRAFSDAMRAAWEDSERVAEGRPDGEAQSVSLITMHSSKGLEWPVVIPVNTMTDMMKASRMVVDVSSRKLTMPFLGIQPTDYEATRAAAEAEAMNERVRLWYVAATRARDLLVIPVHEKESTRNWASVVDLKTGGVADLDLSGCTDTFEIVHDDRANTQDAGTFTKENQRIIDLKRPIRWASPSRHEHSPSTTETLSLDELISAEPVTDPIEMVAGSQERGQVMHKLMEEILTGETADDPVSVLDRAKDLVLQFKASMGGGLKAAIDAREIASKVSETLALPRIAGLRPRLQPEITTAGSSIENGLETATVGVIDAAEIMPDGSIETLIDWKSDVRPTPEAINVYKRQVSKYLSMNGARLGLIVFMSTGQVVEVRV